MNIMKRKSMSVGKRRQKKYSPSLLPSRCFLSINFWQNRTLHTRLRRSKRNPNEIENGKENDDNEQQQKDCTEQKHNRYAVKSGMRL